MTERPELRLARYLREFVLHRTTPVSDIDKYEDVLWFADIPQEADCRSGAWTEDREPVDAWLEVEKQTFEPIPEVPDIAIPWADEQALHCATLEIPPLRATTSVPDEEAELGEGETPPMVEHSLEDHLEVQAAYEQYRPSWEAWSVEHRRREAIQEVYAVLFRLRTQLLKQGEVVEVVLGLGLLNWRTETSSIRRHVVAASVELTFDPDKGVIRVKPPEEGAGLRIEDEMLDANLRPDRAHCETVNEQLAEIGDDIWDEPMHAALRAWAQALSADAQWSPEIKEDPRDPSKPSVTFAPALILRKRRQVGMLRVYDALIDQLSGDEPTIPKGWGGLIKDDGFGGSSDGEADPGTLPRDRPADPPSQVYFPLPTNREQRQIIEALDRQRGVLVQGPPGTGKSHTIANLICHLLATGQRLLVTAETAQALRVIKEMLPQELQPLCVSLLGQGGGAFSELNRAVQGITTKQASYAQGDEDRRISEIEDELADARRALARTDSELRSIRADETEPHSIADGTYSGTASQIARRVAGEREQYGWLQLPREAKSEPPLSGSTLTGWLEILRSHTEEDVAKAKLRTPSSTDLVTPGEFAASVASEEAEAAAVADHEPLRSHPAYPSLSALTPDLRREIADRLQEVESRRVAGPFEQNEWLQAPVRDWVAGKAAKWDTIIDTSREALERAESSCARLGSQVVKIPEGRDPRKVRADAEAALTYLEEGGKWKFLGVFTPQDLKGREYLKEEVLVDGVGASRSEGLQVVSNFLSMHLALEDLRKTWQGIGAEPLPGDLRQSLALAREQLSELEEGHGYADACNKLARTMATTTPSVPAPDWLSGEAKKWLELIEVAVVEDRHRKAIQLVDTAAEALLELRRLHDAHPVVEALADAVEQRNVGAYSQCHGELISIEALLGDQEDRSTTETVLAKAVPGLADAVAGSVEDPIWSDRMGAWEAAWRWAFADAWLQKRSDFAYHQELQGRRRDTEKRIAGLVAHAASRRAWKHFFARLSEKQKAALKGWREAVRAMGKGTGKSARLARLRREARAYMDECRDAIPVWIMPRYLLAEMVNPEPECYDLVIVDEASQLGIDSCFLFYVSSKMIVVGDDQQISPYGIGIPDEAIANLQRRYLDGIPHHHAFSPQSSLYGNANIRFSGRNIVLREHFRCMPEIIQFSNDLCYAPNGTPLDPLRTYSAQRLRPLKLRHVPEGYRTGSVQNAQNPPEAEAIVEQITACIADSRYTGKTLGVISLQGEAQAQLIERMLLERAGAEAIEKRHVTCGGAYAFQGDERDVIFLSLVAADRDANGQQQRIGTLADESAKQRFNVAASRARDQLWLFHTTALDVLSTKCMRRRLLEYMLNPRRQEVEESEQTFESEFERDVFRLINHRGFRVRTQVGVGDTTNHRYRIDLVVEGLQARLAIECDGDKWHGPEWYDQDMARQRDLERAGWLFVRIRGSDFAHDPDAAMQPVWAELQRLGISSTEPGATPPATEQATPGSPKQGVLAFEATDSTLLQLATPSTPSEGIGGLHRAAEVEWHEVQGFYRDHGRPTVSGSEVQWFERSWGALGAAGLTRIEMVPDEDCGRVAVKLRAVGLLAMYLGMYQQGGPLEGDFDDHLGLSVYLEELGVEDRAVLAMLHAGRRPAAEAGEVSTLAMSDVLDIVGSDHADSLQDIVEDLGLQAHASLEDWSGCVEWEMIEEPILEIIQSENSAIFRALEKHYDGQEGLFVSIWNSRFPADEARPREDIRMNYSIGNALAGIPASALPMDEDGEKWQIWLYLDSGMCEWSI